MAISHRELVDRVSKNLTQMILKRKCDECTNGVGWTYTKAFYRFQPQLKRSEGGGGLGVWGVGR